MPDQSGRNPFAIQAVERPDAAHFGAVVQAGFDAPPAFASWFSRLVGRPKWRIYLLAYDGKTAIISSAVFILIAVPAWMGIDATLLPIAGGARRPLYCPAGSPMVTRLALRDSPERRIGQPAGTKRLTVPTATFFGPAFPSPTPGQLPPRISLVRLHAECSVSA